VTHMQGTHEQRSREWYWTRCPQFVTLADRKQSLNWWQSRIWFKWNWWKWFIIWKHPQQRISTFPEILIDSSDNLGNACESIPLNRDSDFDSHSNEIHESDKQYEKHPKQRI
jgi:hypothetical protein